MVKKKLNLLAETSLVHNGRTKIFPDMLFLQNDGPEQYFKKSFPKKSNGKSFKEIKNFHWATVRMCRKPRMLLKIRL